MSEEFNSGTSASGGASNFANGQTVRIKAVNEINCSAVSSELKGEESCSQTNNSKRKIPNWLVTSATTVDDDSGQKRQRRGKNNSNNNCDSTETEIVHPPQENGDDKNENNVSCSTSRVLNNDNQVESEIKIKQEIKEEPVDSSTDSNVVDHTSPLKIIKKEIKEESVDSNTLHSSTDNNTVSISPTSSVEIMKQEATSTTRESCKFGIKCYRRNPMHKVEMAHPGDSDYKRPNYPPPPKGTPECPYADRCYRRNPTHFQEYSHPPSTDFEKNRRERKKMIKAKQNKTRKVKNKPKDTNDDFEVDDYDDGGEEDPFGTDSDEDYIPSDDDDYTDDEFEKQDDNE